MRSAGDPFVMDRSQPSYVLVPPAPAKREICYNAVLLFLSECPHWTVTDINHFKEVVIMYLT